MSKEVRSSIPANPTILSILTFAEGKERERFKGRKQKKHCRIHNVKLAIATKRATINKEGTFL